VPLDAIQGDLAALGLSESVVLRLLEVLKGRDIAALEAEIGKDSPVRGVSVLWCLWVGWWGCEGVWVRWWMGRIRATVVTAAVWGAALVWCA
jgi:hypothetical protein